jgi:hypothetical protein
MVRCKSTPGGSEGSAPDVRDGAAGQRTSGRGRRAGRHGRGRRRRLARCEVRACGEIETARDMSVVVVVVAHVKRRGHPWCTARVHEVCRRVGHMPRARVVRSASRHEAECVHDLVNHRELEVARSADASPGIRVARDGAVVQAVEVKGHHVSRQDGRPGAAAARDAAATVVVDGIDLPGLVEAEQVELPLDLVADEGSAGFDLRVGFGEPDERRVEHSAEGVQPEATAAGLARQPRVPRGDAVVQGSVFVERAVGPVRRQRIDHVDLRRRRVVGAVCGCAREDRRSRAGREKQRRGESNRPQNCSGEKHGCRAPAHERHTLLVRCPRLRVADEVADARG